MLTKNFSIGEALKFGWNSFKSNVKFWLGLVAVIVGLYITLSILSAVVEEALFLNIAVSIVYFFIQIVVSLGLINISLKFSDHKKARIADLFNLYQRSWQYFLSSLLYSLITVGGLLLLIVPGIIWGLKFQFFSYFIVDKNMGPIEALKASAKLTYGVKWDLLGFAILGQLINLLGTLLLFVGLIATAPTVFVATAYIYRQLLQQTKLSSPPVSPTPAQGLQ